MVRMSSRSASVSSRAQRSVTAAKGSFRRRPKTAEPALRSSPAAASTTGRPASGRRSARMREEVQKSRALQADAEAAEAAAAHHREQADAADKMAAALRRGIEEMDAASASTVDVAVPLADAEHPLERAWSRQVNARFDLLYCMRNEHAVVNPPPLDWVSRATCDAVWALPPTKADSRFGVDPRLTQGRGTFDRSMISCPLGGKRGLFIRKTRAAAAQLRGGDMMSLEEIKQLLASANRPRVDARPILRRNWGPAPAPAPVPVPVDIKASAPASAVERPRKKVAKLQKLQKLREAVQDSLAESSASSSTLASPQPSGARIDVADMGGGGGARPRYSEERTDEERLVLVQRLWRRSRARHQLLVRRESREVTRAVARCVICLPRRTDPRRYFTF